MGLIDSYRCKWDYNPHTNIQKRELLWSGLIASNTFLNNLSFSRANLSFKCRICDKEKPKNTRYLGDNYQKICSDCAPEWIENSFKALQEMEMILKKSKENLKLNKEKWRKEMIIGALS